MPHSPALLRDRKEETAGTGSLHTTLFKGTRSPAVLPAPTWQTAASLTVAQAVQCATQGRSPGKCYLLAEVLLMGLSHHHQSPLPGEGAEAGPLPASPCEKQKQTLPPSAIQS